MNVVFSSASKLNCGIKKTRYTHDNRSRNFQLFVESHSTDNVAAVSISDEQD